MFSIYQRAAPQVRQRRLPTGGPLAGHGELGHSAHKIPRSARAVADAARVPSNKRITPQLPMESAGLATPAAGSRECCRRGAAPGRP
eukprot:6212451-Pleurochrysis_carterae.AAC.5